jgi:hypothetical protein
MERSGCLDASVEVEGAGGVYDCALDKGGEGGPVKGLKPTLISAIAIGLLAGSVVGVAAQSDEADAMAASYFTAQQISDDVENSGWSEGAIPGAACTGNAVELVANDLHTGMVLEATDPRISGQMEAVWSTAACEIRGGEKVWHQIVTYRISNDEGAWSGTGLGFIAASEAVGDGPGDAFMATLTGEGAYEGLSATFLQQRFEGGDVMKGVIVPGAIPPASDFEGSEEAVTALDSLGE